MELGGQGPEPISTIVVIAQMLKEQMEKIVHMVIIQKIAIGDISSKTMGLKPVKEILAPVEPRELWGFKEEAVAEITNANY